jgi:hypothetical protein
MSGQTRRDGGWNRDRYPRCDGSLRWTGEKRRPSNASHHVRVYECGNCGREVER